jgi:hypothetical protein
MIEILWKKLQQYKPRKSIHCLKHLWGRVIPWVRNLTEEGSCVLNEISGMTSSVPIVMLKINSAAIYVNICWCPQRCCRPSSQVNIQLRIEIFNSVKIWITIFWDPCSLVGNVCSIIGETWQQRRADTTFSQISAVTADGRMSLWRW